MDYEAQSMDFYKDDGPAHDKKSEIQQWNYALIDK